MADYTVSGAGTTAANGVYVENGANDKPMYQHSVNASWWIAWNVDEEFWTIFDVSITAPRYKNFSASATPPLTGWTTQGGVAPAPTLALDTGDATAPTFNNAAVNTDGDEVSISFIEADNPPLLPASDATGFSLTVNGSPRTISSATASGTNVYLTPDPLIYSGDVVTVAYDDATGNVTDSATSPNSVDAFGPESVTNGSTVVAPVATMPPRGIIAAAGSRAAQLTSALLHRQPGRTLSLPRPRAVATVAVAVPTVKRLLQPAGMTAAIQTNHNLHSQ